MSRALVTWVTTDWHLSHDMLVHNGCRPLSFERQIRKNHVKMVQPGDTLINLGDLAFYRPGEDMVKEILDRMPDVCHVLVLGNHDKKSRSWYQAQGYHVVCESIQIGKVFYSHKPANKIPSGCVVNVHGHFHDMGDRLNECPWYDRSKYHLVSLEETGYKPVNVNSILARFCK